MLESIQARSEADLYKNQIRSGSHETVFPTGRLFGRMNPKGPNKKKYYTFPRHQDTDNKIFISPNGTKTERKLPRAQEHAKNRYFYEKKRATCLRRVEQL
jgi:hypothetical protein